MSSSCAHRLVLAWMAAAFVAVGGGRWALATNAKDAAPKIGDNAPKIELEGLLQAPVGASTTPEALRGNVVVLEFWATWCGPCIASFAHLNKLANEFKDKPVRFLSITDESRELVERFLKKRKLNTWVGLDTNRSVFDALRIPGLPHTVVIDAEGRIAGRTEPGHITAQVLNDLLAGKKVALIDSYAAPVREAATERPEKESLLTITIRPAVEPYGNSRWSTGPGRCEAEGAPLRSLLALVYGVSRERVAGPTMLDGRYDVVFSISHDRQELLDPLVESALEAAFGITTRREIRETDVYALKKIAGTEPKIPKASGGGRHNSQAGGVILGFNSELLGLVATLEDILGEPVVDETDLVGLYDWDIDYHEGDPDSLMNAVRDQLALELVKTKRPLEFLVVEEVVGDQGNPSAPGE